MIFYTMKKNIKNVSLSVLFSLYSDIIFNKIIQCRIKKETKILRKTEIIILLILNDLKRKESCIIDKFFSYTCCKQHNYR